MDAFYASVEQRDDPALRDRPVVVAWRGPRSVVCAASYEARRYGIRSAMPALRAERLCPEAVFVAPDFTRYKAVSRQIHSIFERYTDLIEPLSLDEAYLDVTTPKIPAPSATATAQAIRHAIRAETSLTASAGVAANKFLAKIASDWRKPDGLFVIRPQDVDRFLPPLSVARLPGVGKVMERRLAELGVQTIAELRTISPAVLEERYGRWGRRLHELAYGIDHRPVETARLALQVSAEDTFPSDLRMDELGPHIRRLAERAWTAAQRDPRRIARTVMLKLKTADFKILTRSVTPAVSPESAHAVADIAWGLRFKIDRPNEVRYRLVGVGLSGFVERDESRTQAPLFPEESSG